MKFSDYLKEFCRLGWKMIPLHRAYAPPEDEYSYRCSCGEVPCGAIAKHPIWKAAHEKASSDWHYVSWVWANVTRPTVTTPGLWNVGLLTGSSSGFFVVDVDLHDVHKDGVKALAALEAQYGELPRTVTVHSGSRKPGAKHLYFRFDRRLTEPFVSLRPGIEVLNGGSRFVVAPPSMHGSGNRYAFAAGGAPWETPVASAPDWLIDVVKSADTRRTAASRRSSWLEVGVGSGAFGRAALDYNLANTPDDWPRRPRGPCPVCGGERGFVVLHEGDDERAAWWDCKSASHRDLECGVVQADGSRGGTALDIDAYRAGVTKKQLLVREGYLR
jgi:hypothetical protein